MSGKWVVSSCSCGFGGGDDADEFDTMQEARDWVEYLDAKSDRTVLAVTAPDGSSLGQAVRGTQYVPSRVFDWTGAS